MPTCTTEINKVQPDVQAVEKNHKKVREKKNCFMDKCRINKTFFSGLIYRAIIFSADIKTKTYTESLSSQ